MENREPEQPTVEHTEAEPPEAEPQGDEGSALRDLIMSYAGSFDSDLDVRRHYGGPGPQLEPDRFEQPFRRRRRR